MKRFFTHTLYLILICTSIISCVKNDDNISDTLLAGTTWEYKLINVTQQSSTTSEYYSSLELFQDILEYSEEIIYADSITCNEETESTYTELLTFGYDNTCTFKSQKYIIDEYVTTRYKYRKMVFIPATHTIECSVYDNLYTTLTVESDGIYIYPDETSPYQDNIITVLSLEDYTYYNNEGVESVSTERREDASSSEESFVFQRTEDDLVIENNDKRIIGEINRDTWELNLTQITPEKYVFNTLKLK